MKVAAIQFAPKFKQPKENIHRAAQLVVEAVRNGAQLVVLPELITTGYSFLSPAEAEPFAEVPGLVTQEEPMALAGMGWSIGAMAHLSLRLGVKLVWGFIEKDPGSGKLYNSQAFLETDLSQGQGVGAIRYWTYRKINRWGNDFIWSAAGESNPPVIRTMFDGVEWKVGMLICRDIRDKKDDKWNSFYEPGDADVVAFSANWGDGGFPANGWMDFVEENKTNLVVANRYGREENNNFGEGGICVIEKSGRVLCDGVKWNQDCIVYADLSK